MKRFVALILACALTLGCAVLSSCGGGGEATKPQNVFRETVIDLPEDLKGENMSFNSFAVSDDTVNMMVYSYDSETYEPNYFVARYDLETGSFLEPYHVDMGERSENGGTNLNSFTVSEDGAIYLAFESYSFDDETGYTQSYEIHKVSGDKTDIIDVTLPEDEENGGFYINSMEAASDGSLVLVSWNGIRIVRPDGKLENVELPDSENSNVENIIKHDGKLYVSVYTFTEDDYGSKLYLLDPAAGKLGDAMELATDNIYNMIFGPGYDYYYNDRSSLWGASFDGGEMTEVINFINSDINGNDISDIIPITPDRFFLASRTRINNRNGIALSFLDRVPEDEIVEKKMLRLAVSYAGYDLRSRVIEFNKSSDEYRITIDDYSRYNSDDNYQAGIEKLNSDIITGNTPDIFLLNQEMPYTVYAARGVFADMYELMDQDPDFDRSLYLENILKAFEYNGKLVSIFPGVNVNTFAVKAKYGEELAGWDLARFAEFAASHPDMRMFDYDYNRDYFVQLFMAFCRDRFIDPETGECDFDNEEFRTLLTIAKSIPEQTIWETGETDEPTFWQEYDARYKEDRVLLSTAYISDLNYSYKNFLNYTFGEEPAFVGFPSGNGNGAVFEVYEEYAIADDSDFKEGAWEFIKRLIDADDMMPTYDEEHKFWNLPVSGIPIAKAAVEKMAEIAMTPVSEDEQFMGGIAVPLARASSSAVITGELVEIAAGEEAATEVEVTVDDELVTEEIAVETEIEADAPAIEDDTVIDFDGTENMGGYTDPYSIPLTEKQVNDMLEVIYGTTLIARVDRDMNDIINEELAPFFKGTQSLDDTVKHIENRVSIYLSETR